MLKNSVFKPSVSTQKWAKAAGIRSIKTMAQTAVAVIGTGAVISAVDWKMVVSSAIVAGIVSIGCLILLLLIYKWIDNLGKKTNNQ